MKKTLILLLLLFLVGCNQTTETTTNNTNQTTQNQNLSSPVLNYSGEDTITINEIVGATGFRFYISDITLIDESLLLDDQVIDISSEVLVFELSQLEVNRHYQIYATTIMNDEHTEYSSNIISAMYYTELSSVDLTYDVNENLALCIYLPSIGNVHTIRGLGRTITPGSYYKEGENLYFTNEFLVSEANTYFSSNLSVYTSTGVYYIDIDYTGLD